jgi:hypothetical protein
MKLLDRSLQKEILEVLAASYPGIVSIEKIFPLFDAVYLRINISYLAEHGLVVTKMENYEDNSWSFYWAKITAKGLDFLAEDGGLGAILGVQTIRLHEDSIRQILIAKVEGSDADETVKAKLIEKLKSLPADGLAHLGVKLLDAGVKAIPNAINWLQQNLLG